jgi:hypothetical protein
MLDQAFGLTATSRLGCQVILTKENNNLRIRLPKATRNFYVVCFSLVSCLLSLMWLRSLALSLSVFFSLLGWTCTKSTLISFFYFFYKMSIV